MVRAVLGAQSDFPLLLEEEIGQAQLLCRGELPWGISFVYRENPSLEMGPKWGDGGGPEVRTGTLSMEGEPVCDGGGPTKVQICPCVLGVYVTVLCCEGRESPDNS